MDPILIGLFTNALWAFGDTLIYKIPQFRRDRKQAEDIKAALEKISGKLEKLPDKPDDNELRRIGKEFMEKFRGSVEELNSAALHFKNNKTEIMDSLTELKGDHRKIEELINQVLDRLPGEKAILLDDNREDFIIQVAEIFQITGHKVQRDVLIGRKNVDISAAFPMSLGRPEQITYINCVHDHKATYNDMDNLSSIISKESKATGMMVSQYGFEPDALELAKREEIISLTYDELVDNMLDLTPCLERCIEDYNKQGVEHGIPLKKLYVEQDIIEDITDRKYPLSKYAADWLGDSSKNLLVILGDFGMGKTSYTLKLASELAQRRRRQKAGIIPVRIELKNYRETVGYENMINYHLSQLGVSTTGYQAFDFLLKTGKILLILDAFDEMAKQINEQETKKNFDELYKSVKDKSKVILTCRTHYFKEHEQFKSLIYDIHAPAGSRTSEGTALYQAISGRKNCKICFLQSFDDDEIGKYLTKASPKDSKAILDMLKNDEGLKDLATRPVLLPMIVDSYNEIKGKSISKAALYEVYICKWVERDDERVNLTKDGKEAFAEQLAVKLWAENKGNIHHSELRPLVEAHFKPVIRVPQDAEYAEHEVRTASFLTRDSEGNYGFAHKSFMEYFLARKFMSEVEKGQIIDFGRAKVPLEIVDFMADMIKDEKALVDLIRNRTSEEVGYAGANVVSILRKMKDDNLSNLNLSNCVLSYADFGWCPLTDANLSGAYMDNIKLTTYPFSRIITSPDGKYIVAVVSGGDGVTILKASDFSIVNEIKTEYGVSNLTYSPDGKYIVGVSGGVITIFKASDFFIVNEVKTEYNVRNITYSPDGKYIAIGGGGVAGGVTILKALDFSIVNKIKTEYDVFNLTYSPDGKYIVVGGSIVSISGDGGIILSDSGVTILKSSDFSIVNEVKSEYSVSNLIYSPDGKYIAVVGDGGVTILKSCDLSIVKKIRTEYYVDNLIYSPDGKYIVVGGGSDIAGDITILRAFDFSIVKEIKTEYYVSHIIYSPDGEYIVVSDGVFGVGGSGILFKGGIIILDAETFQIVKKIKRIYNDVRGMKIDGARGLDPVIEDALKRAIGEELKVEG